MNKGYVLITGAYGGLGEAMAVKFAQGGYNLVLLGRSAEKLQLLEQKLAPITSVVSVQCDVSSYEGCKQAYQEIKAKSINIKILINNAGVSYIQQLNEDYDIEKYQNIINTNLNGAVYLTQLLLSDLIQNKGSIINISSVIGFAPVIGRTAYAASKFGMEGFFSVLQAEMDKKIHIMMVYPTFIDTQIRDKTNGKHEINEILTSENVAHQIFRDFHKKKQRVYYGKTAKLSKLMYKFFPNLYVNLMRKKIMKTEK